MKPSLRSATTSAITFMLYASAHAQQPNLLIYGNFEEPYGTCAPAPTGVVQLGGGCFDVQKWPMCGGRWWAWQRQVGTVVTGGAWPLVSVANYAVNQSTPLPVSGSRMVRHYTNASTPLGTTTIVMYQRLGAPLTAGANYFMRWRSKAIKNPAGSNKYRFEVVHGNDNGIPCTPVPAASLADYPTLPPLTNYENQTANIPFLDNQSAFTFTALGGENYVGLRITIEKNIPVFSASSLWIDDLELYDASLPIPSSMMAQLNEDPIALRSGSATDEVTSISALPNPTNGILLLSTVGFAPGNPVLILAPDGRNVRILRTNDSARLDIDLTAEPAGMYTVRIANGDRNEVIRVIKE